MRIKSFLVVVAVWAFVLSPLLRGVAQAVPVRLPSGRVVDITQAQLEALKTQPGIQVVQTIPEKLAANAIVVPLPAELGGGYIIGTPQAVALALNTVGVTVGATAVTIGGMGTVLTSALSLGAFGLLAAIAEALAEEEEAAAVHHAAVRH